MNASTRDYSLILHGIEDGLKWLTFNEEKSTIRLNETNILLLLLKTAPSATELGVSVKIDVGEGEPVESALRRFKREVNKSGHLMELRHRRYFENSQEKKKRKVKEGRMRKRLERMQRRRMNNRT